MISLASVFYCFFSVFYCCCFLYVSCSGPITSVGDERELICMLSFTCNYAVSVRRGFLSLMVLGIGCVFLLWHSLGLPHNFVLFFRCSIRVTDANMLFETELSGPPFIKSFHCSLGNVHVL